MLGLGKWSDKSMKKCYIPGILMMALARSVDDAKAQKVGSVVMFKTDAIMHVLVTCNRACLKQSEPDDSFAIRVPGRCTR